MRPNLRSAASAAIMLAVCLLLPAAAGAANAAAATGSTPADLKAEIDGLTHRIEAATNGVLKWDGAEHIDLRQDGRATVAEIVNAQISIQPQSGAPRGATAATGGRLILDQLEIRQTQDADGSSLDLTVTFPKQAEFRGAAGSEVDIALKDGTLQAVLNAATGHSNAMNFAVADGRIDLKESGDWIKFGSISGGYKLTAAADGSWSAPNHFEMKGLEFFLLQGPTSGSIDRIAGDGRAAGPDLAAFYRVRDRVYAVQQKDQDLTPATRGRTFLALLPDLLAQYSLMEGDIAVDGLSVRNTAAAAPLVSLAHAEYGYSLKDTAGSAALLRFTYQHDGLALAPSVPNADSWPRRFKLDFGIKNINTGALRNILAAAAKMPEATTPADRQLAGAQIIGAAAALDPALRLYHLTYDAPDFGLSASAVATGSPISPKGYTANGDVAVRDFDAAAHLVAGKPIAGYLPLLKVLGTPATAPDGTKRLDFHLASAPPKWLTLNGNDVTAWFAGPAPAPDQPRLLRPAVPAMRGDDVRAVQYALGQANIGVLQNGVYDGETMAAVARFQKANGLDVDGVVDAATRTKLGLGP